MARFRSFKPTLKKYMTRRCPKCGSKDIEKDNETGYPKCNKCGLLLP